MITEPADLRAGCLDSAARRGFPAVPLGDGTTVYPSEAAWGSFSASAPIEAIADALLTLDDVAEVEPLLFAHPIARQTMADTESASIAADE